MRDKGVTLIEVLIVIVIMGIIAAFAVPTIGNIVENAQSEVDDYNIEFLATTIETAYADGTLTIKNNRLYNNSTNRGYSGTGSWFVEDMGPYIGNRVIPQLEEANNSYNKDSGDGLIKYWFQVDGNNVHIYYWNDSREKVILTTAEL